MRVHSSLVVLLTAGALFMILALVMHGQDTPPVTCIYTLTRTPVGPVMVFRNGLLQRLAADYGSSTPAGKTMPTITPAGVSAGDMMSAVYTRAVPLSVTVGGQTTQYWGYALYREDWDCR